MVVVDDVLPVLVEESHPSNLKLPLSPLIHVAGSTFCDIIGLFEQSVDPLYTLNCICPLIQVYFFVTPPILEQTPGKKFSFICISPLQSSVEYDVLVIPWQSVLSHIAVQPLGNKPQILLDCVDDGLPLQSAEEL